METITPEQISSNEALAKTIVQLLDKKQARRIKLLDVEELTSLTSYFIICEGRSSTHVSSLADEITDTLKQAGYPHIHSEGYQTGNWIAIDLSSVIVHIFDHETREFYSIEKLWRDGKEIDISDLLERD